MQTNSRAFGNHSDRKVSTIQTKPKVESTSSPLLTTSASVLVSLCMGSTLAYAAYTREPDLSVDHKSHKALTHDQQRKIDRTKFFAQLKQPHVIKAFAGRMHSEVGGQGRNAAIAWAETTFNRAEARKQTLLRAVTGNYFPTHDPGSSNNKSYHEIIWHVARDGTNITRGATGNASASVGFGQGSARRGRDGKMWAPGQTAAFGGERFGVEAADKRWKPKYLDNSGNPVADNQKKLTHLALLRPPRDGALEYLREKSEEHLVHQAALHPPKVMMPHDRPPQVTGKYPHGLHPVIKESMLLASRHLPLGYKFRFDNAARENSSVGGASYHLQRDRLGALAVDIEIIDPKGRRLRNLQSPATFAMYRDFMHWTKKYQYDKFPQYRGRGRWGGYFVSGVAADLMHYDLGPEHGTQAGTWERGLKREYAHFGKPQDIGKGMGPIAHFQLPNPFGMMASAVTGIPQAMADMADRSLTAGLRPSPTRMDHPQVRQKKTHRRHQRVARVYVIDEDDDD